MSTERELLRRTVAALVEKHAGSEAVRTAMASHRGYDETLWRLLCEQVGAAALVVPEEFGGAGGELADAAVVLEELGKALVPSPLLGTILAELALLAAPEPDRESLAGLAAGALIGTVVIDPRYVLNGDLLGADDIVIGAEDGQLHRWATFTATRATTMDPTRRLGRVADLVLLADNGRVSVAQAGHRHRSVDPSRGVFEVTAQGAAWNADVARGYEVGALATAAQLVGAGQAMLDIAVDYAKQRTQFGRVIGSYQAIKHKLADVHIALELARPLVYGAALSLADDSQHTARDVSAAKVAAADAALLAARSALQTHGAIGFTSECDLSLWLLRAQALRGAWGDPAAHRRRVLAAVA